MNTSLHLDIRSMDPSGCAAQNQCTNTTTAIATTTTSIEQNGAKPLYGTDGYARLCCRKVGNIKCKRWILCNNAFLQKKHNLKTQKEEKDSIKERRLMGGALWNL
jgi:hypothetical protein